MSTLPITSPVDLSERDNKEALIVKKEVETNDAGVFEEVVVKVARDGRIATSINKPA